MHASGSYVAESEAERGRRAWLALIPAVLASLAGSGDWSWPPHLVVVRRRSDRETVWTDADGLTAGIAAQRAAQLNEALAGMDLVAFESSLADGRPFETSTNGT